MSAASHPLERSGLDDPVLASLCRRYRVGTFSEALIAACRAFVSKHDPAQVPLRLDPLLRAAGARREARAVTGDGRLEIDADGQFVVVVESGQHWSRQRFTLTHELAHIVLFAEFVDDRRALRRLRSPEAWEVVERACNAAAAELLMPGSDVSATVKRHGLDPNGLSTLQMRYAVSWSALLVRLSEVLRVSVAVFRHHARRASEPERWRVHRCYGAAHGVWLPGGLTTRHLSVPVVEQAAVAGIAEAGLVIDEPMSTRVQALASSMTLAREAAHQDELFGRMSPERLTSRPEVAVFFARDGAGRALLSGLGPSPFSDNAQTQVSRDAHEHCNNLTLW